jgi:hypothetical protein
MTTLGLVGLVVVLLMTVGFEIGSQEQVEK